MMIVRAALGEDFPRPPQICALIADAADALPGATLPGAFEEVDHLATLLGSKSDVSVRRVSAPADRDTFLRELPVANLVHFAGHGRYNKAQRSDTGLLFRQGLLGLTDVPPSLSSGGLLAPVYFWTRSRRSTGTKSLSSPA